MSVVAWLRDYRQGWLAHTGKAPEVCVLCYAEYDQLLRELGAVADWQNGARIKPGELIVCDMRIIPSVRA